MLVVSIPCRVIVTTNIVPDKVTHEMFIILSTTVSRSFTTECHETHLSLMITISMNGFWRCVFL